MKQWPYMKKDQTAIQQSSVIRARFDKEPECERFNRLDGTEPCMTETAVFD